MSSWRVEVTAAAERYLTEAALYIQDVFQNPPASLRLLGEFEECVEGLSEHPALRLLVRDERRARKGYRWAPAGGYMAFYTMNEAERTVYVERIPFSRLHWRAVL